MKLSLLITVVLLFVGAQGQFNPTLSVDSCTKSKLVVTLTDGADGGIIYIQGQGAACKQTTFAAGFTHEFDFGSCGITWEESFKMIVQKKSLYQTGDDKQIPIMCIADLSDITVDSSLIANDKDDDAGQNLTVKPTAFMRMYSNGNDVSGGNVKLTDVITMAIELDAEFIEDFDIKAKDCTAATIPIIDTACSTDIELFPNFIKPAQGLLSASFGAFRTTDLNGGAIGMTFSCTLQVCLGTCPMDTCANGDDGWGRKKRSLSKRAAGDDEVAEVSVGTVLRVATEEVILKDTEIEEDFCINQAAFFAAIIVLILLILAATGAAVYLYRKVQQNGAAVQKLSHPPTMTPGISIPMA